jgi:hypothetical protein
LRCALFARDAHPNIYEGRTLVRYSKWILALVVTLVALVPAFLFGSANPARGVHAPREICGVVPATVFIDEDTRLTCDVVCETEVSPCIQFARPNIKLSLNGFKMTGPANPPANCVTTQNFLPADGIASIGQNDVVIEGPGIVQRFRRWAIALSGLRNAVVKRVTSHENCFSGLQIVGGTSDSLVEEVVSVRNALASSTFPCGGICITNSHNNRIRRSELAGNGSAAPGTPVGTPNDFGVGLTGNSSGNVIEENGIGGNINGILLFPATQGNLIRKNVIAGNPPIQVSATSGAAVGVDIRDFSASGANRFKENLCITYEGASPSPCLKLPQFAGHQNN